MALPAPTESCIELEIDLQALLALVVNMPGGISLQAQFELGTLPNLPDVAAALLGQLNSALAPLMPFFRLLEVVLALIEVVLAIPDALGPPPDPSVLINALAKLGIKASALASLIPNISIPIMLVGICRALVAALQGLRAQLLAAVDAQAELDAGAALAAQLALDSEVASGAAKLQLAIDCAQVNLDLSIEVMLGGLGPLQTMLGIATAFASLAGINFSLSLDISGALDTLLSPLDEAIDALNALCASIPA